MIAGLKVPFLNTRFPASSLPHLIYTALITDCPKDQHIIHLSLNWAKTLQEKQFTSSTDITRQVGLSSGRVRQTLRLSNLDQRIIEYLQDLEGSKEVKQFTENRLRKLVPLPDSRQFEAFQELLESS